MKYRLILQTQNGTPDGMGGFETSWVTVATIWGDIMPVSMRERTQGEKLISDYSHKIIVRYTDIIPPIGRFVYESRAFNIVSAVNPDNSGSYLTVYCHEEFIGEGVAEYLTDYNGNILWDFNGNILTL
jgi:SPP1 family predicted phage head-tail adaptor